MRRTAAGWLTTTIVLTLAATAYAEPDGAPAGRLSESGDRPLPLLGTQVDAEIVGTVATVTVRQVYENPWRRPIEATYAFPLPDRAAVDGAVFQIGARTLRSELLPKEEADARYAGALDAGRTAALTTQLRPNLFTQRVANILGGERVLVELTYTEELRREGGETTFVFPVVAAPRCGAGPGVPGSGGGFLAPDELPRHKLDLRVRIDAAFPISAVGCASHRVDVRADGGPRAEVSLHSADRIPDRDFVLTFRTATEEPEVSLTAHRTGREGTFCLTIQPEEIATEAALVAREMIFVLDTSGSMKGDPIEIAKRVTVSLLRELGPRDRFRVLRFADGAEAYSDEALPANSSEISSAAGWVRRMKGKGDTKLLAGLEKALEAPEEPYRARTVLFLTDGLIDGEAQVLRTLAESLGNARVFALGVGSSPNRFLLERLADLGHGHASYLREDSRPEEIEENVRRFLDRIRSPVLNRLEIDWGGLPVHDLEPARLPDVFAGQPIRIFGRYDAPGVGAVTIRGIRGSSRWEKTVPFSLPAVERRASVLPRLWARERIRRLLLEAYGGERSDVSEEVTALALRYRLLTRQTAFVAVDERIVTDGERPLKIRQKAAWPRGVGADDFFGILAMTPRRWPFGRPVSSGASEPVLTSESRPTFGPVHVSPTRAMDLLGTWQEKDGSWKEGGDRFGEVGATALALLAMDARQVVPGRGRHGQAMRRGYSRLARRQDADGCFGPREGPTVILDHSLATIAWIAAGDSTRWRFGKSRARRAVEFLLSHRVPDLGWARDGGPEGSDTLATAFAAIALAHARRAGIEVDDAALRGAEAHFEAVTDRATGRIAVRIGDGPVADGPAIAAAILARAALGEKVASVHCLREGARRLLELPPAVGEQADALRIFLVAAALKRTGAGLLDRWSPPLAEAVREGMFPGADEEGAEDLLGGRPGTRVGRSAGLALFALARAVFEKESRAFPLR